MLKLAVILWKRSVVRGLIYTPQKDKVLLIKSYISRSYSLPGGAIEKGETSEEALLRELNEELGISPELVKKVVLDKRLHSNKRFFLLPLESSIELFEVILSEEVILKHSREVRSSIWVKKFEKEELFKTYFANPF